MPLVLLLFEYPTLSGGERSILTTLEIVRTAGFEIQAIAPPSGPLPNVLQRKNVLHWPLKFATDGRRRDLNQIREDLHDLIARIRPDLIHANSLSTARICGPVAAELKISSIGHLRDIIRISRAAIDDLNRHHRLLAVSNATRDFHVSAGLDPAKVFTLYNGIDLDEFRPRTPTGFLHRELHIPTDRPLIGAIGQIGLRKGFDLFLKAAELVSKASPDAHFVIAGERFSQKDENRQFESDLDAISRCHLLRGRVHFLGFRDDIARIVPEFTMLVHPARQEPLGRVLLEAAACGISVVATDVGGTGEILGEHTPAARIVDAEDATALATAVGDLLETPSERRRLGELARRRVETRFDRCKSADNLISHYRTVLDAGPRTTLQR
ncbi:MAG: glycosyltransferase family 4 protein [Pirellulales bacterium]